MFLKIVKNSSIVDATQALCYVRQNPRNKQIISCAPEFANGILSSDRSQIYHLNGLPAFISGSYDTVSAVEVCQEEYESIRAQLDGIVGSENPEEIRNTLSTTEMMDKLDELTDEINILKTKNTQLETELLKLKQ